MSYTAASKRKPDLAVSEQNDLELGAAALERLKDILLLNAADEGETLSAEVALIIPQLFIDRQHVSIDALSDANVGLLYELLMGNPIALQGLAPLTGASKGINPSSKRLWVEQAIFSIAARASADVGQVPVENANVVQQHFKAGGEICTHLTAANSGVKKVLNLFSPRNKQSDLRALKTCHALDAQIPLARKEPKDFTSLSGQQGLSLLPAEG